DEGGCYGPRPTLCPYTTLFRSLADLLVRKLQEVVEQPQLVHDVERRRVDRVAPEVPEEIGVLLEHEDGDAGARQDRTVHRAVREVGRAHALNPGDAPAPCLPLP